MSNLFDFLVRGGIADTTRMPSDVIGEGHKSTVHRYRPVDTPLSGDPVLFVPLWGPRRRASICAAGVRWPSIC